MTWSGRRQLIIILIFLFVVTLISIPIISKLIPDPTCSDGRQNQDEEGVDCGGVCVKACIDTTSNAQVLWTRSFMVSEGVASAVAYIVNPNPNYAAKGVRYVLKIYNKDDLLLAERYGSVDIPLRTSFPVFEGGIQIGSQVASSAHFQFLDDIDWQRTTNELPKVSYSAPNVQIEDVPRIFTRITNDSGSLIRNLPVAAIVYDRNGNAIGASETFVPSLERNASEDLVFTWLQNFPSDYSRVEIYPRPSVEL